MEICQEGRGDVVMLSFSVEIRIFYNYNFPDGPQLGFLSK